LAFKTAYELERNRHENDKKVVSLYDRMRDMMGVLLLYVSPSIPCCLLISRSLKHVKNDNVIAPDGINVEDRLKSLVECTADDIKICSNVCDAYTKKRLLAKVLLSSVWDAKLFDFVKLFAERRREFEFELSIHTNQGVDKANVKLDAIGDATRELTKQFGCLHFCLKYTLIIGHRMDAMKALFQELVSPEQKRLAELVAEKGGFKALRNNDKMLLNLEETASKSSSPSSAGEHRIPQAKSRGADLNLNNDIFEDPNDAAEKNWAVFSRKFEVQKNQIIDKLTLVVQRESDRVIRGVQGSAHERIRDRVGIYQLIDSLNLKSRVFCRRSMIFG
jgi:hypothetical protein